MTITYQQLPWTIESLYQRRAAIILSPPYQRGLVWTIKHKQYFIDSIARGYPIPDLFYYMKENGNTTYEVIDGQQRTNAIIEFKDNKFRLHRLAEPVDGYDIANKRFKDLHPSMQERINNFIIPIKCLLVGEYEQADIFTRLGNSVPLSPSEKRHAITGSFQQYCEEVAATHPFFKVITMGNNRFSHETLLAQLISLELTMVWDLPIIRGETLTKLYVDYRKPEQFAQPKLKSVLKRVKLILDYVVEMFENQPTPILKTGNHIWSLYALLSVAMKNYESMPEPTVVGKWLENLFKEAKEHVKLNPNAIELEIAIFISATSLLTNSDLRLINQDSAHSIRVKYMIDKFKQAFPELVAKQSEDPRLFSEAQRIDIFFANGKRCQICNCTLTWRNWHADHIIPYSKGGKTEVSNGQALCPECNRKKSNRLF